MPKKTRRELKEMFKKGAQPTAEDYADKIESGFNSLDDGISKPEETHLPIRIKANGADQSILDFFDGEDHTWRINQLSKGLKAGFNIETNSQDSRLFIQQSNGNVGLGTNAPEAKVHVIHESAQDDSFRVDDVENDTTPFRITNNGSVHIKSTSAKVESDVALGVNGQVKVTDDDGSKVLLDVKSNGAVGIGVEAAGDSTNLQIAGDLVVTGKLTVHEEMDIKAKVSDQGNGIVLGDHDGDQVTIGGKLNSGNSTGKLEINDAVNIAEALDVGGILKIGNGTEIGTNGAIKLRNDSGSRTLLDLAENGAIGVGIDAPASGVEIKESVQLDSELFFSGSSSVKITKLSSDITLAEDSDAILCTQKAMKTYVDNRIPKKTVVMWSGDESNIPDGWSLYTAMQDRFIVGAGGLYTAGTSGEPDRHNHSISIPTRTFTTTTDGAHKHTLHFRNQNFFSSGNTTHGLTGDVSMDNAGGHSHSVTVDFDAFLSGDSSGKNRPKWYALCFIIKD